jgi:hypothetical protein
MKKIIWFFIMFIGNHILNAQIQITQNDLQNAFESGTYWVKYNLEEYGYGAPEMNLGSIDNIPQNWVIPNINWRDTLILTNVSPSSTPFSTYFPTATHAQYSTGVVNGLWVDDYYQYFKLDTNAFYVLGNVKVNQYPTGSTITINNNEQVLFTLPLNYGAIISLSRDSVATDTGYTISTFTKSVDAFGTLNFPFGTFDALRTKDVYETKSYSNGNVISQHSSIDKLLWIAKNGGILEVRSLYPDVPYGNVYVDWIEMTKFNSITPVEEKWNEIYPDDYKLNQNFPNPFNPSTTIRYSIPSVIASETKQSQFVSLKVYDVLGNEIAILVNEEKPSGSYEVEFSASNLPSGTYFYQLRTGSFVETKKMILLK